jgi:hypothetical protein
MKYIAPSITATAFNCPHCGVLTTQHWHYGHVEKYEKGKTPLIISQDDPGATFRFDSFTEAMRTEQPFIFNDAADSQSNSRLYNLDFTQCYQCEKLAVWIFDRLIYPVTGEAPPPNPDLPEDIKADYLEASSILHLSPRAASALTRTAASRSCTRASPSPTEPSIHCGRSTGQRLSRTPAPAPPLQPGPAARIGGYSEAQVSRF